MPCEECERLKSLVLEVNLDYINADSELLYFANRSTVSDDDGEIYRELITKLANARSAYETAHRRFVEHKICTHGEESFASGR